jgi:hypothetical protein
VANNEDEPNEEKSIPLPPIPNGTSTTSSPLTPPKSVVENIIGGKRVSALQKHLYDCARDAARSALHLYLSQKTHERLMSALSMGAAVEWMMSALICKRDPVLLGERGSNFASSVALSRAIVGSAIAAYDLKTINFGQMLTVLGLIHKNLNIRADATVVMDVRNAAAHMAMENPYHLRDAALKMVRVISALHMYFEEDEKDFWGEPLLAVVSAMQVEYENEMKILIESKIARALAELEALLGDMDPLNREEALLVLERRAVRWELDGDAEYEPRECPACHRHGVLSLTKEMQISEHVITVNDEDGGAYALVPVIGIPTLFQCPVCNLTLWSEEFGDFPALSANVEYEAEVVDDFSSMVNWDDD